MMVRYWMTESLVTIKKTATLFQLLECIHQHKSRRFPVVDEGKLIGIVSVSDLYRLISPRAISKGKLPQKYKDKLSRHTVSEIMITEPLSCTPNDHLEDVADLMREKKIGALPVLKSVHEKAELVGIITESDVLAALVSVAGGTKGSKRISLKIPRGKKAKEFYEIINLCEAFSIEVITVLTHPCDDDKMVLMTLRVSGANVKDFVDALWESHHQVLTVE